MLPTLFANLAKRTVGCKTFRFCEIFKCHEIVCQLSSATGVEERNGSKNGEVGGKISDPIKMAYASYEASPTQGDENYPLIIMHGLLGSKNNWQSLSKAIHRKTNKKVIAVDARNHGDSPHTKELTYNHLAADVRAFMADLGLKKATMLGHSMGGRTMMLVALKYPEIVEKLIVEDISPIAISPSLHNTARYLEAMKLVKIDSNIPLSTARKYADVVLSKYISDLGLRNFLITNLVQGNGKGYKWRVNLDSIIANFPTNIVQFPPVGSAQYTGPTLFIGGGNSDYLRKEDEPEIKKLFPNASFVYIPNAGHWVHSEQPEEFKKIVTAFLEEPVKTSKE